jgi:hypothetical protein
MATLHWSVSLTEYVMTLYVWMSGIWNDLLAEIRVDKKKLFTLPPPLTLTHTLNTHLKLQAVSKAIFSTAD